MIASPSVRASANDEAGYGRAVLVRAASVSTCFRPTGLETVFLTFTTFFAGLLPAVFFAAFLLVAIAPVHWLLSNYRLYNARLPRGGAGLGGRTKSLGNRGRWGNRGRSALYASSLSVPQPSEIERKLPVVANGEQVHRGGCLHRRVHHHVAAVQVGAQRIRGLPPALRPVAPAPRPIAARCPGRAGQCGGNAASSGSRPPAIRRAGHRRPQRHRRPAGALISRRGSQGSSPSVRRDAMVNPASWPRACLGSPRLVS
ncbi:hypothetical protein NB723_003084 [Xanthomonas sacchari]|nr:hypothetical protein [Xanthomonas sacchari]